MGEIWRLTLRLAQRGPLELAIKLELLERLHAPRDQHKPHHAVRVVPQLIHLMHLEKRRARAGPWWRRGARAEAGVQLLRVPNLHSTGLPGPAEYSVPRLFVRHISRVPLALRQEQPLPIDEVHAGLAAPLVLIHVG